MRIRLQGRHAGLENLAFVLKSSAVQDAFDDFDTLSHDSRWTNFLAFPLADLLHENLGSAQTQQESIAGEILHDAGFHRNLHRVTRVGRDDAPSQLNPPGLCRNYRQYG